MFRPLLVSALTVLATSETSCGSMTCDALHPEPVSGSSMIQTKKIKSALAQKTAVVDEDEQDSATDEDEQRRPPVPTGGSGMGSGGSSPHSDLVEEVDKDEHYSVLVEEDDAQHPKTGKKGKKAKKGKKGLLEEVDNDEQDSALVEEDHAQKPKTGKKGKKAKKGLLEENTVTKLSDSPDEWVSLVNEKRANHGACPLAWAAPLADGMKEWVDGLTSLHHADSYHIPPPGGPAGENLAWASNGVTAAQSVEMWYSEVNDCATPPPGCQQPKPGKMTGHFTAMVWKGARTMGCAISANGEYSGCRWKAGDRLSADTPNMAMPGLYEANVGAVGESASGC